ncbi:MAG: GNAT family N-acetyltransferase [Desulfobacterales bacterium]
MVIRPSQNYDVPAMSRVYVQTWQDTYLGVVPYGYLYAMSAPHLEQGFLNEQQSRQVVSYVAEDAGGVIGFISGGYERQGDNIYNGEIYALYVLKNHQRQGIGTKLVSALATQFNHFGIYSMLVWVLEHNPYRRFYERINGIYLRNQRLPFAGEVIDVAAYGWLDTSLINFRR